MRRRSGLSPAPIEFLPQRFYLVVVRERTMCSIHRSKDKGGDASTTLEQHLFPRTPGIHFVSLQEQLLPCSPSSDFVLGIPQTIRFNSFLTDILSSAAASPLIGNPTQQAATGEYSRRDPDKVHYFFLRRWHLREEIQAIHLICRWRLLYLQLPPHEALAPFEHLPHLFSSFFSSSDSFDPPNLRVSLAGIAKGLGKELLGHIGGTKSSSALVANLDAISVDSELEPNLWIISRRFIIYGSVHGRDTANRRNGNDINSEAQCAEIESAIAALKRRKVSLVVTLSKATPNINTCAAHGLETLDISASTTPTSLRDQFASSDKNLVNRFLEACESTEGLVAVNGSSGSGCVSAVTCIGCYLMKHSNLTSQETIGWLRFCLPVKIPTAWELFLGQMQSQMWLEGEQYRREGDLSEDIPSSPTVASPRINIGNISLGRVSLLGTRDRARQHFYPHVARIPVSACHSSRSQESHQPPTTATTTAQLKRRPLTQGSAGSRRYHRSTDGTSSRADFALMHKFLHQTPSSPRSITSSTASSPTHTVPSRPKAARPPNDAPTTCAEALA